jgi:hypothetical protein
MPSYSGDSDNPLLPGGVDAYLKNLKPKPRNYITNQQIFDGVVRQLYRQKNACFRIEDSTGKASIVNFNMQGHKSPILYCMTQLQLRNLQRSIGYETLRDFNAGEMMRKVTVDASMGKYVSETDKKLVDETLLCLNENNINAASAVFLLKLDDAHKLLAMKLVEKSMTSDTPKYPNIFNSFVFDVFYRLADSERLDTGVLQFSSP